MLHRAFDTFMIDNAFQLRDAAYHSIAAQLLEYTQKHFQKPMTLAMANATYADWSKVGHNQRIVKLPDKTNRVHLPLFDVQKDCCSSEHSHSKVFRGLGSLDFVVGTSNLLALFKFLFCATVFDF